MSFKSVARQQDRGPAMADTDVDISPFIADAKRELTSGTDVVKNFARVRDAMRHAVEWDLRI